MALSYSGTATLRCEAGVFGVHADLRTDVSGGVYSWGGKVTTSEVAVLAARGQDWTLTIPGLLDAKLHVAAAGLADAGVVLRVHGHARAPYEQDGDITATKGEDGATVYQVADK